MEQKNKYISVIVLLLLLFLGSFTMSLYEYSENLEKEIAQRDTTIMQLSRNDSIYSTKTKEYSEVITKYIENCNFYIDGKQISTNDLIKLTNQLIEEKDKLEDSLLYFKQKTDFETTTKSSYRNELITTKDSLQVNSYILGLIKRDYGITYNVETKDGYRIYNRKPSKADSAIVLFPYYKNKLSYDTLTKAWNIKIQTTRETIRNPSEKKSRKK
jgi:hypothetical protein